MAAHRLITKDGEYGVRRTKAEPLFSSDIYQKLISCNWICFFSLFASFYISSWMIFALMWYFIAYKHGDLEIDEKSMSGLKVSRPCVKGLRSFPDALFFSIDLQSTMGYGRSEIQDECPVAVTLFFLQCLVGIFVQTTAVSLLFTKFSSKSKLDGRQHVQFPARLKLVKIDRDASEDAPYQRSDLSKSYDNLNDLSQSNLNKYVKNPNAIVFGQAKTGKLRTKNKLSVSGSADYLLQLEFKNLKELMSVNVHGFLITKKISCNPGETKMEICSTKSIALFDDTVDSADKFKFHADGYKYVHNVDRHSPLRPYLVSMMKSKPKKFRTQAKTERKLKLARSIENLRDELSNIKLSDLKLTSPVKSLLDDFRSNHSCDDASLDSDTSSFDAGKLKHKRPIRKRTQFRRRFLELENEKANSKFRPKSLQIAEKALMIPGLADSSVSSLIECPINDVVIKMEDPIQVEIAFFVEGVETGTGLLIEAKISYELEDIAASF